MTTKADEGDQAASASYCFGASDEVGKQQDPISKLADELEAATGFRPTTLVCTFPLNDELLGPISISMCLKFKHIDRDSGVMTFEVLPP